jgi:hypothetical protein
MGVDHCGWGADHCGWVPRRRSRGCVWVPEVSDILCRLDIKTMFKIREWERFKFMIDYVHDQASEPPAFMTHDRRKCFSLMLC